MEGSLLVKQEMIAAPVQGRPAAARGDIDGAIAAYREAIRLRPDFLQAHRHLGSALRRKGDLRGALESCRHVLRLAPGDAEAMCAIDELVAEEAAALLEKAGALAADGNLEAASSAYCEVVWLRPDCAEARNGLGALLAAKGDFEGAARECREAVRLRPDWAEAHFNLGNALAGAALSLVRKAGTTSTAPSASPASVKSAASENAAAPAAPAAPPAAVSSVVPDPASIPLILTPAELKVDEDATRTQTEPVRKGGNGSSTSGYRAAIREGNDLAERGDLDGAVERYRQAVRIKPDVPEAHNNLGVALRRKGDFDGAIASFQTAVRLKPDAAEAHNNLAVALRSRGDYPSAIVSSREATRLRPDLAAAWYNLACAYALAGDAVQAAEGLRQAIGIDVKFRDLARREPDLRRVRRAKEVMAWLGEPEK